MNFLDDPTLSWESKGLLAYCLRGNDRQSIDSVRELRDEGIASKTKFTRIMNEIRNNGYGTTIRYSGDNGRIYYETWFYSTKQN